MDPPENSAYQPTVGVICPLERELTAVTAAFDESPDPQYLPGHNIPFFFGRIGKHQIVAVTLPEGDIGQVAASDRSHNLKTAFPGLSYHFIVGIAGGIPDEQVDIRLGDVVVATSILKHDSGKHAIGGFQRKADQRAAPSALLDALPYLKFKERQDPDRFLERHLETMRNRSSSNGSCWTRPEELDDVLFKYDYDCVTLGRTECASCDPSKRVIRPSRPSSAPVIHRGMITSGDVVMKYGVERERIREDIRNLNMIPLAIEMEAALLKDYIVVRGICDYADSHKNKRWQDYAAATAAACFKELLCCLPPKASFVPPNRQPSAPIPAHPSKKPTLNTPHEGTSGASVTNQGLARRTPDSDGAVQSDSTLSFAATFSSADNSGLDRAVQPPRENPTTGELEREEDGGRARAQTHVAQDPTSDVHVLQSASVTKYSVSLPDMQPESTQPLHEGHSAEVSLTELRQKEHFKTTRMLMLRPIDPPGKKLSFWIPLDGIRTKIEDAVLLLAFSDCRKKRDKSVDFVKSYFCVHDPAQPNVFMRLDMADMDSASALQGQLLHTSPNHKTYNCTAGLEFTQDAKHCQIQVRNFAGPPNSLPSGDQCALFVTELQAPSSTAILYLDEYIDFDNIIRGLHWEIHLRQLQRVKYLADQRSWALWPPPWVKQNPEGKPDKTMLENQHALKAQFSDEEPFKLFVTELTGFTLEFCSYVLHTCEKKKSKAQVTVWTTEAELRILCKNTEDGQWFTSSLKRSTASIMGNKSSRVDTDNKHNAVLLGHVQLSKGPHVQRSSLLATSRGKSPQPQPGSQEFQFDDERVYNEFLDLVSGYATSPPVSTRDTRSSSESAPPETTPRRRRSSGLSRLLRSGTHQTI